MSAPSQVDSWLSQLPAWMRGTAAIMSYTLTVLAIGFAAGSWGVRGDIEALRDSAEEAARARQQLSADVATNRAQIAGMQAIVQQTDLVNMSERVRRIDRELCLMRTSSIEAQQECARR